MNDDNEGVRAKAAAHADAAGDILDIALMDQSAKVRAKAAGNTNATDAQLDTAFADLSFDVRIKAVANPNMSLLQLDAAIAATEPRIRKAAVSNPSASADQVIEGFGDSTKLVQRAAAVSALKRVLGSLPRHLHPEALPEAGFPNKDILHSAVDSVIDSRAADEDMWSCGERIRTEMDRLTDEWHETD